MIAFTEPIEFDKAVDRLKAKDVLPTFLTSDELSQLPVELREKSFFSARQMDATLLQGFKDATEKILAGTSDPSTQVSDLHDLMDRLGTPQGDGSISDIYSDQRIKLILRTQTQLAQGYGQWKEGNAEGAIDAYPAQELIRFEDRMVPREWFSIWDEAADGLPDTTATSASDTGRMVAMKNDPIWLEISDFGVPWPPFKFNSGMGTQDISYSEAVDLGVMDAEDDPIQPADDDLSLNDGDAFSVAEMDASLVQSLGSLLGRAYDYVKGFFVRKPDIQNRFLGAIDALLNANPYHNEEGEFTSSPYAEGTPEDRSVKFWNAMEGGNGFERADSLHGNPTWQDSNGVLVSMTNQARNHVTDGLSSRSIPGVAYLEHIESANKGRGEASKTLAKLTGIADKNEIELRLWPKRMGKGLSTKNLEAWYGRNGFKKFEGSYWNRPPKSLLNFNPSHKPSGPGGGQFASGTEIDIPFELETDATGTGYPEEYAAAKARLESEGDPNPKTTIAQTEAASLKADLPPLLHHAKLAGVESGTGGWFDGEKTQMNPNITVTLQADTPEAKAESVDVMRAITQEAHQKQGNLFERASDDDATAKNGALMVKLPQNFTDDQTKGLFGDLNKLKDSGGNSHIGGFTVFNHGGNRIMAIGDQFYSPPEGSNYRAEIIRSSPEIDNVLNAHKLNPDESYFERFHIQTHDYAEAPDPGASASSVGLAEGIRRSLHHTLSNAHYGIGKVVNRLARLLERILNRDVSTEARDAHGRWEPQTISSIGTLYGGWMDKDGKTVPVAFNEYHDKVAKEYLRAHHEVVGDDPQGQMLKGGFIPFRKMGEDIHSDTPGAITDAQAKSVARIGKNSGKTVYNYRDDTMTGQTLYKAGNFENRDVTQELRDDRGRWSALPGDREESVRALQKAADDAEIKEAHSPRGRRRIKMNPQVKTAAFKKWFDGSAVVDAKGNPEVMFHGTRAPEDFAAFKTDGNGHNQDVAGAMGAMFGGKEIANSFVVPGERGFRVHQSEFDPQTDALRLEAKKTMDALSPETMARIRLGGVNNVELEESEGNDPRVRAFLKAANAYHFADKAAMATDTPNRIFPVYLSIQKPKVFSDRTALSRFDGELARRREDGDMDDLHWIAQTSKSVKAKLLSQGYDGVKISNDMGFGPTWIAFHPTQIKSALGNKGTFSPTDPDIRNAFTDAIDDVLLNFDPNHDQKPLRTIKL